MPVPGHHDQKLYDKIRPLMDAVDIKNLDPQTEAYLSFGELSGAPKKLEESD